jgi:hypothetical protein
MPARAVYAVAIAVMVMPLPWPCDLAAQQRDTAQADTLRPFVRGGVYDKPWLTRLAGRTVIGGYGEAHARYQRTDGASDGSGFVAKRFNLFVNANVSEIVRFAAELEVEEGGREVKVEFAAVDLSVHSAFVLRGGMILSPLGRFNLAHDSPLNDFTDRPVVATDIVGVALSEPGFGALGQLSVGRSGRITYEAYLTNGFHNGLMDDSEDGTRVPLGRGNFEDNNGEPALVARLAWSPVALAEFGISAHHGAYNVFEEDGLAVDERRTVTIAVVDWEVGIGAARLAGEFVTASVGVPPGLTGIYAERQQGWYVEGVHPFGAGWVRTLPGSAFEVKLRGDAVDFDRDLAGDDIAQVSAGVNFRPTRDTAFKLDYVRGRMRDRFVVPSEFAKVLLSLATYF